MTTSVAEHVASMPEAERAGVLASMSDAELASWAFWGRPEQHVPPGDGWRVWLILAGRGWGKTRTGAEAVHAAVRAGGVGRVALVGATAADARDVMVEGESGLLATAARGWRPVYEPSKRRLTWPSGAMATTYSADEPERLRGPQHGLAWADELAAWRYAAAWDMLMLGLRLGVNPRAFVTTTPKRTALVRALVARARTAANPAGDVVMTRGSTYANAANLAGAFVDEIVRRYEGTALGRQELHAELLDDATGALWKRAWIDGARGLRAPALGRVVVAVDPPAGLVTECGIVAAGEAGGRGYVLEDATVAGTPDAWARAVVACYHRTGAGALVAEANQGGEMVRAVIETVPGAPPVRLIHARASKAARAEPVAALYEQGRVLHVGTFAALEDEMCNWVPGAGGPSPNRLDAAVHALADLMVNVPGEVSALVF